MWNSVTCNPSFEKFLRKKELRRSKKSLVEIGPLIKILPRKKILPITTNTKKSRIKAESIQKIESSNRILLRKMLAINNTPSSLNKVRIMPRTQSAGTLNLKNRMEAQNKIIMENKRILEKLQGTHSFYSAEKWEIDYQYHKWVKNTHLKIPSRIEKKLNPLMDEKSFYDRLGIPSVNTSDFNEVKNNFFRSYNFT